MEMMSSHANCYVRPEGQRTDHGEEDGGWRMEDGGGHWAGPVRGLGIQKKNTTSNFCQPDL